MRIPTEDEGRQLQSLLGMPDDYIMSCYIGVGYPAEGKELEQYEIKTGEKILFNKGKSQSFWNGLIRDILDVEKPEDFII